MKEKKKFRRLKESDSPVLFCFVFSNLLKKLSQMIFFFFQVIQNNLLFWFYVSVRFKKVCFCFSLSLKIIMSRTYLYFTLPKLYESFIIKASPSLIFRVHRRGRGSTSPTRISPNWPEPTTSPVLISGTLLCQSNFPKSHLYIHTHPTMHHTNKHWVICSINFFFILYRCSRSLHCRCTFFS